MLSTVINRLPSLMRGQSLGSLVQHGLPCHLGTVCHCVTDGMREEMEEQLVVSQRYLGLSQKLSSKCPHSLNKAAKEAKLPGNKALHFT